MKHVVQFALLCVLVLSGTGWIAAQQDFSQVKVKASHVKGNLYMLNGTGGNVGVSVGADGILIVDDKFAPLADKIRAALQGIGGGKLKFILNTHWHGDHTGGNVAFGPEAPIIAHINVRRRLTGELKAPGRDAHSSPQAAWPVITFNESLSVHFNGEEIKAIHFPHGHTDGDTVVFFTLSNVVHLGDDFFAGRFPFVDLASGGDVKGLIKNIAEIISRLPVDVTIIPGHGPVSKLRDLKIYHRMLTETTQTVHRKMQTGKSLKQIQAEGVAERWKTWGAGFISTGRWIETIYNSFSRKE